MNRVRTKTYTPLPAHPYDSHATDPVQQRSYPSWGSIYKCMGIHAKSLNDEIVRRAYSERVFVVPGFMYRFTIWRPGGSKGGTCWRVQSLELSIDPTMDKPVLVNTALALTGWHWLDDNSDEAMALFRVKS